MIHNITGSVLHVKRDWSYESADSQIVQNLCEGIIQPDGQNASLLVEWRRGVLLVLVSSSELGVVCGGEGTE